MSISNTRDTTRSTTYTYDDLNRLLTAQTNSATWGNSYVYDAWGNLLQKNQITGKTNSEPLTQTVTLKNQFTPSGGFNYDVAGNLLANGSAAYSYDAENRLAGTAGVAYMYDGDGERVAKTGGTLYWNGANGPLAESDLSGNITAEYVFFNGKRIARRDVPSNAVQYYFSDHLGSGDVVASATGVLEQESE